MESNLLTRKEAAQYLKIGISTLRKLDIPKVMIHSRVLYTQKALDKFILSHQK